MEYPLITYSVDEKDLLIDENEVLRYLGYSKVNITYKDIRMLSPMIEEARKNINPRGCYRRFELELKDNDEIVLPYGTVTSRHLSINLKGCHGIYMIAATIGAPFDRMMIKERVSSMSRAAIFQAIGATAVESFVENMCDKLAMDSAAQGEQLKHRYSPGFGDYDLSHQVGFFKSLQPERYAGITLNDSLIMSPEKSVTAIIGIYR